MTFTINVPEALLVVILTLWGIGILLKAAKMWLEIKVRKESDKRMESLKDLLDKAEDKGPKGA
jgi:hypothetical protein